MGAHAVTFASPGARIRVTVTGDAPEAARAVAALFPDLQVAPGGQDEVLHLTLSPEEGGWTLRREGGPEDGMEDGAEDGPEDSQGWHAEALAGILTRLELTVAETLVAAHPGVALHAGGVVGPGGGAVLVGGPGGSGKSSLTTALALGGAPVLGDDVVLLHQGLVHPFPRLLKVEDPVRGLLGLDRPPGALSRVWEDVSFYHPEQLGTRWAAPAPVSAVVLPTREPGSAPLLEERRPSEVLPDLLSQLVLVARVEPAAFEALADALAGARCFRLRYWETSRAAAALRDALAWTS